MNCDIQIHKCNKKYYKLIFVVQIVPHLKFEACWDPNQHYEVSVVWLLPSIADLATQKENRNGKSIQISCIFTGLATILMD